MTNNTHRQLANFIWDICNLLRGPYKRNEYRKVILPLTVLRRFDALLSPTKNRALEKHTKLLDDHEKRMQGKNKEERTPLSEAVIKAALSQITGLEFYNLSPMRFAPKDEEYSLLNDPDNLALNLNTYIDRFSPDVREIINRFKFGEQLAYMNEKGILYEVVKAFCSNNIDLSAEAVDNQQMGYVFEELIRIGAEQSNEEAGEHFTPREVTRLMVNLLLAPEEDLAKSHVVKTLYDPACGTGGILAMGDEYLHALNADSKPLLYGQDWNDEAWAVCKSDMLIKGSDAENIIRGDTFSQDGFTFKTDGSKWTFDYMMANPPFGVEWKQQQKFIENEYDKLGYAGRFGAGLPRINDGALLFLQHMISKMQPVDKGGSRIGIVFNGSPLFTGDAGSGESEIRRWIIENDWLDAIVALPEQLFYNTGIATYIWIVTNKKVEERKGRIQLIDARHFWVQMEKSLGNKRRRIGECTEQHPKDPDDIADITRIYHDFVDGDTRRFTRNGLGNGSGKELVVSRIFNNADFGYYKVTVERPLKLSFAAMPERVARLSEQSGFRNLASSKKKKEEERQADIAAGKARQQEIRHLLESFRNTHGDKLFLDRKDFRAALKAEQKSYGITLSASERKSIEEALGERDENAAICVAPNGKPEPDTSLRDTENIPLTEDIDAYIRREVLPHVPDAWVDKSKTKVGYEIPLNRHFYVYEPPRPLEVIAAEIKELESDIMRLLAEVAQ